jgi:hypothetical protein
MNTFEVAWLGLVALVIFGSIFHHEIARKRTLGKTSTRGDFFVQQSVYGVGGAEYSGGSDTGSCGDGGCDC